MTYTLTLDQWLINFKHGDYDQCDATTYQSAGWITWQCQEKDLCRRTQKFARRLNMLAGSKRFNPSGVVVQLFNTKPTHGRVYDFFILMDTNDHKLFCVIPRDGHEANYGKSVVLEYFDGNDQKLVVNGTWKDVIDFFNGVA